MSKELVFVVNTQDEYWRREFQGRIFAKDDNYRETLSSLISDGIIPIFQLDEDSDELAFLSTLPKHSLIGWCHSDEKFDLKFNLNLSKIDSIKLILRPYKLNKNSIFNTFKSFGATVCNAKYTKNLNEVARLCMWQLRGCGMQIRQFTIKTCFKFRKRRFLNIPIGYTNIFAKSISEILELEDKSSILEHSNTPKADMHACQIVFTGQSGQIVREVAIRALEKTPGHSVTRRSSYGASNLMTGEVISNGLSYINNIFESSFVLCPPGNISGESFRIFETISARRLPIFMNHVSSDPDFKYQSKFLPRYFNSRNWGKLLLKFRSMSEEEYASYVVMNSNELVATVNELRNRILEEV